MIYYIQIPCFITRDLPNRTAIADRWLVVPVEADTQAKALERTEKALIVLAQEGRTPRETDDG